MTEVERELRCSLEPVSAPDELWDRIEAGLEARASGGRAWRPRATALLLAAAAAATWYFARPAGSIPAAALEAHRHPARLDMRSGNPSELRAWIVAKTALAARLAPHSAMVRIAGARVLPGGRAAIVFQVDGYPATLVIGRARGGRVIQQISTASIGGLTLYTWQARGQDYALVSSAPAARRACLICHA